MNKKIEEAAREYAANANVTSENFCTDDIPDAFTAGAAHVLSLLLSQRLTDEEREKMRKMYSEAQGWLDEEPTSDSYNSCLRICAVTIQDRLESIFGKELFGEGEG